MQSRTHHPYVESDANVKMSSPPCYLYFPSCIISQIAGGSEGDIPLVFNDKAVSFI